MHYEYSVPLRRDTPVIFAGGGVYDELVPRELLPDPVVPEIGPPTSPMVNGVDAFTLQAAAGSQPVISWSPPIIGTASKYLLTIGASKVFAHGEVASVTFVLYDRTSLMLPPGILATGGSYYGSITAVRSPDRLDDPILRLGSPTYMANTLFGLFSP